MASTYTANSGIEKPGSGEQSGTWGATTNTNFDIIDRVLSGVGAITLSGTTHTLTSSDGAMADGHYKVLVLGGSPSGTNTITISPNDQDKVYLVHNNTSQSAIFTQGSGGNATIAAGAFAWIFADGAGSGAEVTKMTVDTASIEDSAITTAKIADNAVTAAKLASTAVFASGTRMIFHQTAAPTGWTKDTSHNDKALRITSGTVGTGGTVAFETAFASQTPTGSVSTSVSGTVANHTLTTAQMPAHRHQVFSNNTATGTFGNSNLGNSNSAARQNNGLGEGDEKYSMMNGSNDATVGRSQSVGGGQAHNHGWSGSASSSFSGSAINLDVQFVDIIICQKD
tara:strand:- start:2229 stop:3248 length:1020 start_codon:yes stop_codon:yes gene_type:complete